VVQRSKSTISSRHQLIDTKGAVYSALFHARRLLGWHGLSGLCAFTLASVSVAAPAIESEPAHDCPPRQISETARVSHVHDGDTLRLTDGRKIRLIGIDTPELARQQRPAQPYAREARAALVKFLQQSDNRIGLSYGRERHDRYQRTLAHLYLPDGRSLQALLLTNGYATAFTTPPNDSQSPCYRQAEAVAREQQRGIWSLPRYRVKTLYQLDQQDDGFSRIQGVVSELHVGKKALWIHLGKTLQLRIDNRDLANFDAYSLQQLRGKTIRVRGWLHRRKNHYFMALRHRDALSIL